MNETSSRRFEAFILGFGSIATQAAFIKLILSSQVGGEIYAALAIGGWILTAAIGVVTGTRFKIENRSILWLLAAFLKIPLAFFIFIYPGFFTGILDPLRFLPLIAIGLAPVGIVYGILFPALIVRNTKAATIYRNEAIGSVLGGLAILLFALAGLGNFVLLFLISGIEISAILRGTGKKIVVPIVFLIAGFFAGPWLDRTCLEIRWPGFDTEDTAHGFSGLWAVHSRGEQITISHNGRFTHTIPDRQSSEEALLWPFLYMPAAKNILLIGLEGIDSKRYLPNEIEITRLISDKAYLRLGIDANLNDVIADPLSFSTNSKFDIIDIYLQSGGDLGDYRFETEYFFKRYSRYLTKDGVLFVSAPSDENYIAPDLARYLSGIYGTLFTLFDSVAVIPGPRIGFVCYNGIVARPLDSLKDSGIDSPYFNRPLVINRLMPPRMAHLKEEFTGSIGNSLFKPSTVTDYLQWLGSMYARGGYLFRIYKYPYPLLYLPAIIFIPLIFASIKKRGYISYLTVTLLGAVVLGSEIAIIFLFQLLFGNLYLQLGLILALFMTGMALGAHYGGRLRFYAVTGPMILSLLIVTVVLLFIESGFAPFAVPLLYLASAASGFCGGAGYSILAEKRTDDRAWGATLYGMDLYGALAAALFVPGLILILGAVYFIGILIAINLVISATLWYSMV